jgi:aminopeptidase-like protein
MFTYKTSKQKDSEIDKAAEKVLKDSNQKHQILDYNPGSDDKHFCSPAFDIILGTLCRTEYGCFPEYHTSADNLKFIKPEFLKESFNVFSDIIFIIENNKTYINLNPKCEPQLGRRGIYKMLGGHKYGYSDQTAMHWILNFTNGNHSLLDIAIRSKISFKLMKKVADKLEQYKLLEVKKQC